MRSSTRIFGACLALAVLLLPQACDNSYGIFQGVQEEREQKGQDIFKKKAVTGIVTDGTYYYAATTHLYRRPLADGSAWMPLDIAGHSDYVVYGLAAIGTNVYVSADIGVFELGGTTLSGFPASKNEALFTANSQLFLSSHDVNTSTDPDTSTYTLYHLSGTAFQPVSSFAPTTDKSIRGVAFGGGAYYFAAEDLLVSGGSADGTGAVAIPFSKTIWRVSSAPSGAYIATTDGNLYRNGVGDTKTVASVPLTSVVEVPRPSGSWMLLVGTDTIGAPAKPNGYYEATNAVGALSATSFVEGENGSVALSPSVYATSIADMPVHAFLYDGTLANGTLFIGIAPYSSTGSHYGLYSSSWTGSSWTGWKAE